MVIEPLAQVVISNRIGDRIDGSSVCLPLSFIRRFFANTVVIGSMIRGQLSVCSLGIDALGIEVLDGD